MNQAERYLDLIARCPKRLDAQYRAAFYLLSMNEEIYEAIKKYVDMEGIHFNKIHKVCGHLDKYQKQIVYAANDLFNPFNSAKAPTLSDISCLGVPYVGAVVAAVMVCADQAEIKVRTNPQGLPELSIDTTRYHRNLRFYQAISNMAAGPLDSEKEDDALCR